MDRARFMVRVVLPVALPLAGALVLAAMAIGFAVRSADHFSIETQTALLTAVTAQRVEGMARAQRSIAVWDDAVENLRADPQGTWVDVNFGRFMFEFFGDNLTYVLDAANVPVYASSEGSRVEVRDYRRARPAVAGLVERVREASDAHFSAARQDGADPPGFASEAQLAVVDGRPAVVAVTTIVPEDGLSEDGAPPDLLVNVKYLDRGFLQELVVDYQLTDAHFDATPSAEPGTTAVPLLGADGRLVTYLVWTPFLPGSQILARIAPPLAGVAAAFLLATGFVLLNLWRKTVQLVTSREEAQALAVRSAELASRDALTQIANRRVLLETAEAWLADCGPGRGVALHYVDIDDFKGINDAYGHGVGDAYLREVAARLVGFAPAGACVARHGGDEFAILTRDVAEPAAIEALAARLVSALRVPIEIDGLQVAASGSVGSAVSFDPQLGGAELFRRADVALFAAKEIPGGGRRVFDAAMDDRLRRERQVRDELALAIEHDDIEVAYQPITDVGGRLVAVEALARWTMPDGTPISPAEFIRVAEHSGQISRLTGRVIAIALADAAGWPGLKVSLNVTPNDLASPQFVPGLEQALGRAGLPAARCIVEVTESALMERQDLVSRSLGQLRAAGMKVAIDDFGTGFSNFARLGTLPVDIIKVDRSMVVAAGAEGSGMAVLGAVVGLARAFGLEALAEGVETPAQHEAALRAGCTLFQGFLYDAPMTAGGITALLAAGAAAPRSPKPLTLVHRAEDGPA